MMNYNFDEPIDRRHSYSFKWAPKVLQQVYGTDKVLPMGIADMDFKVAPPIAQAIQKRASQETYGYCYPADEFLEACVNWQKRRNNWNIEPDWIIYTPGLNLALTVALEISTQPGDQVIVQSPVYYPYYDYVTCTGRRLAVNELVNHDGYYEINFAELEKLAQNPKNKFMILCNPHNPVGRVWTREELIQIGRICIDNGVMLAVDEIHSDLTLPPYRHIPFASISEEFAQHSIICTSPSKTFNLAGLLVSDVIIPNKKIRDAYQYRMKPYYLWPGDFGLVAQIAAYTQGDTWLDALRDYLKENARFLGDFIAAHMPEVRYQIPEATYLAWLDFNATGLSPEELWDLLIHKAKVATNDGRFYSITHEGDGFQRLNFACPRSQLEEALTRIATALKQR